MVCNLQLYILHLFHVRGTAGRFHGYGSRCINLDLCLRFAGITQSSRLRHGEFYYFQALGERWHLCVPATSGIPFASFMSVHSEDDICMSVYVFCFRRFGGNILLSESDVRLPIVPAFSELGELFISKEKGTLLGGQRWRQHHQLFLRRWSAGSYRFSLLWFYCLLLHEYVVSWRRLAVFGVGVGVFVFLGLILRLYGEYAPVSTCMNRCL